jgi:aminoglycoside phosphotransferase (APT) family kinase protein
MSDISHLVSLEGLKRFLDERFGPGPEPEVRRLGEGHSNLTFLVTREGLVSRGDEEWVLRRPPRGDILPGTHEMDREFTVMRALADNGMPVPVPRPSELCTDGSYIGASFYLMDHVEGVVVRGPFPVPFDVAEHRRAAGFELVDKLAAIHAVDWRGIGLESLARKPASFLERNLRRMQQLYDAVRSREVPEIDRTGEWLRTNAPEQKDVTLTHGDYKLDNVMLAPEPPVRIAAVIDWEISTIGDPLVDLGWMLYFSPSSDEGSVAALTGGPAGAEGYPSRAELAERYAERTGRSLEDLRFYVAMAGWKIAIIMEGSYRRMLDGMADDPMFAALDEGVPALARRSLDIIEGRMRV